MSRQWQAFAATFAYRGRLCYAGVAEFSVYVDRDCRGRGVGRLALAELIASRRNRRLLEARVAYLSGECREPGADPFLGFREVGVYEKHGQLDGVWRDVVIVERLIPREFSLKRCPPSTLPAKSCSHTAFARTRQ